MNDLGTLVFQPNIDGELLHLVLAVLGFLGSVGATVVGGILVGRYQRARKREDDERAALLGKVDKLCDEVAEIRERIARCRCADPP